MLRYKACRNSIVTLELLADSKTNEKRDGIVDKNYAKFRCDKAKVIDIINVKTGEKMKTDISIRDERFEYSLEKFVETDFYTDLNEVCAGGIHYFKTKEAAVSWFYRISSGDIGLREIIVMGWPDGKWSAWYENGQKKSEKTYKHGKLHGEVSTWYENGYKKDEEFYGNGNLIWTRHL